MKGVGDHKMEKCYQFQLVEAITIQKLVKKFWRYFATISIRMAQHHDNKSLYK